MFPAACKISKQQTSCSANNYREFKKTATAKKTETSLNERFNEQNNGCAPVLLFLHGLPSSAKQQREMTKFCDVLRTLTTTTNVLNLYLNFITVFHIKFRDGFDSDKQSEF